jgi:hypothetical protein
LLILPFLFKGKQREAGLEGDFPDVGAGGSDEAATTTRGATDTALVGAMDGKGRHLLGSESDVGLSAGRGGGGSSSTFALLGVTPQNLERGGNLLW